MTTAKPSNPKDAMGIKKVPMSCVSAPVLAEVGLGMLEGALKYGRHNYRVIGVRASVYYDAAMRHMMAWWEGEDTDPDSGLSHVTKAIASLVVLRDAMIQDTLNDDRPPKSKVNWVGDLNQRAADIIAKYPDPVLPYTERDNTWIETAPPIHKCAYRRTGDCICARQYVPARHNKSILCNVCGHGLECRQGDGAKYPECCEVCARQQ